MRKTVPSFLFSPCLLAALAVLVLGCGIAMAQPASGSAMPSGVPASGQCYAILIGGLAGEPPYAKWYADWITRFQAYLVDVARVPAANITTLQGNGATFDTVAAALKALSAQAQPQDQVIVFIVGQGEIGGAQPTLALPGPDPTASQLASALAAIRARNQVVLNFSASSGDFLKSLSAPGRVNLTATSPGELEAPVFAEFFLRGLESKRANAANKGTIDLLEAFNGSAEQTAAWISRWQRTSDELAKTSTWKASGKEAVEIFHKLYGDCASRKLDSGSDAAASDVPVSQFVPAGGQVTAQWNGRRVIDEHALLEDCGQGDRRFRAYRQGSCPAGAGPEARRSRLSVGAHGPGSKWALAMMRLRFLIVLASVSGLAVPLARPDPAAPVTAAPSAKSSASTKPVLYRDNTPYPPLQLAWNAGPDLGEVLHVFPHPLIPTMAVVTQSKRGLSSRRMPESLGTRCRGAVADKVGVINDVAFHPLDAGDLLSREPIQRHLGHEGHRQDLHAGRKQEPRDGLGYRDWGDHLSGRSDGPNPSGGAWGHGAGHFAEPRRRADMGCAQQ